MPEKYNEVVYSGLLQVPISPKAVFFLFSLKVSGSETHSLQGNQKMGIYFQQQLCVFLTAGIPAPVYFGILIDTSCLKWGFKRCGSRGSCRLYDSNAFRYRIRLITPSPHYNIPGLKNEMSNNHSLWSFTVQGSSSQEAYSILQNNFIAIYLARPFSFSPFLILTPILKE